HARPGRLMQRAGAPSRAAKQFQGKWTPVFRPELLNQELRSFLFEMQKWSKSNSRKSGNQFSDRNCKKQKHSEHFSTSAFQRSLKCSRKNQAASNEPHHPAVLVQRLRDFTFIQRCVA